MAYTDFLINIILFAISLIGFIFGLKQFLFRKKGALYPKLITLGFGAFMMGRLQGIVAGLALTESYTHFNFGVLGTISCFLFLFTANYGVFDRIIDDRRAEMKKYRIIPIIAPAINIAICLPVFFSGCSVFDKFVCCTVLFFVSQASYFNFKHAIFPDVEFGIADSIRGYNLVATLFSFFSTAEYTAHTIDLRVFAVISHIGMCVCIIAAFPLLRKGVKTWTV